MLNLVRYTQEEIVSKYSLHPDGKTILMGGGCKVGEVSLNQLFTMMSSLVEKARAGSLHKLYPKINEDGSRKELFSQAREAGLIVKVIERGSENNPDLQKQASVFNKIVNDLLLEGITTKAALIFSMAKNDPQSMLNTLLAEIQRKVLETYCDLQKRDRQID